MSETNKDNILTHQILENQECIDNCIYENKVMEIEIHFNNEMACKLQNENINLMNDLKQINCTWHNKLEKIICV